MSGFQRTLFQCLARCPPPAYLKFRPWAPDLGSLGLFDDLLSSLASTFIEKRRDCQPSLKLTAPCSLLRAHCSVLTAPYSVLSSQFSVLSSQFSVLSSQFSVLSSQFSVHDWTITSTQTIKTHHLVTHPYCNSALTQPALPSPANANARVMHADALLRAHLTQKTRSRCLARSGSTIINRADSKPIDS